MAIMRWDPFGEVLRMQRDMDRIFSRMGVAEGQQGGRQEAWMPKIDIKQSGNDMQVRAELPGLKPEDVDIEVTEGVLTIRGERRQEEEREDEGWLVRESSYGAFQRSIALPESVDPSSIQADYKDGVLELTVPRAFEQAQPKTTKITVGQGSPQAMTQGEQGTSMPEQPKGAQEPSSQPGQGQEQPVEGSREHAKL